MNAFFNSEMNEYIFGEGTSAQTGSRAKYIGTKKALVVTDKGVRNFGLVDPIVKSLEDAGIQVAVFDEIKPDPSDVECKGLVKAATDFDADTLVVVGGGSSIDTAKAANIMLQYPESDLLEILNKWREAPLRPCKLIVIPTIAGTGSEVSSVAIITSTALNDTKVLCATGRSDISIVDPALMVGVPPYATAATSMDTLSHAIEKYLGADRNELVKMATADAIKRVWKYGPLAVEDGSNMEARSNLALASSTALMFESMMGIGHGIGQPIGHALHLTHGHGIALALPLQIEYLAEVNDKEIREIAEMMALDPTSSAVAVDVANAIRKRNKEMGLKTPKELDIDYDQFMALEPQIVEIACNNTAKPMPKEDYSAQLVKMYG